MIAEKKRIEDTMQSLSRYYTGKKNSLDTASEMFKGLITVFGLIVPADDVLICKSLVVPAVFVQGKGKGNLFELYECERGLIINIVYNREVIYKFLSQYKTKEEKKIEEGWTEKRLNENIAVVTRRFVNERIDTHSFDSLFKEIYRATGIVVKIGTNADIVWNGEHSVYITSRALQHEESSTVFKIHFAGKEFKKYMMIVPHLANLFKLAEVQNEEEKKKMESEYKRLISVLTELEEGDVLDVEDQPKNMEVVVLNEELRWRDTTDNSYGAVIQMTFRNLNTLVRVRPRYVGWQEALEAYENGHRIECEYNGEMVWFKRDIASFEEQAFLQEKGIMGLLTAKWIVKEKKS